MSAADWWWETTAPPNPDGLHGLARRLAGEEVRAVIESMNGVRFVHDRFEADGWEVQSTRRRSRGWRRGVVGGWRRGRD
jgi:hypothetical protein